MLLINVKIDSHLIIRCQGKHTDKVIYIKFDSVLQQISTRYLIILNSYSTRWVHDLTTNHQNTQWIFNSPYWIKKKITKLVIVSYNNNNY